MDKKFSSAALGVVSESQHGLEAAPESDSTAAFYGHEGRVIWRGKYNLTTGGWITGGRAYVDMDVAAGTVVDKVVTHISQTEIKGSGTINTVLGYEAEIIAIASSIQSIGNFVGWCFPDLSALPNRSKIQNLWSFANNDRSAHMKNSGRYLTDKLAELTPAHHLGINPGRYYSTLYQGALTTGAVTPNVIYVQDVFFPTRDVLGEVGVEVTVAHNSNARFALFSVVDGKLGTKIADFGEVSMNAVGARTIALNVEVDAGTYFLCANFQGTPTVRMHTISSVFKNFFLGQNSFNPASPDQTTYYPFTYGAYPDSAGVIAYSTSSTEPHLWFRCL